MDYNLVWAIINELGKQNGLWYAEKHSLPTKEVWAQSRTSSIRPPRDRRTIETQPIDEIKRNARGVYFNSNLIDLQLGIVGSAASAFPYSSGRVSEFVNALLSQLSKMDFQDAEVAVEVFSKAEKTSYRLMTFDTKATLAAFVQSEIANAVRSNEDRISWAAHPPSGLGCIALCHADGQQPRFTFLPIWVGEKFYSAEPAREQNS
jgi:hypothetical protein